MAIHRLPLLALTLAAVTASAFSQDIQKLDPVLDHIVGPDARLERVATGFDKWTEGPVWTREGTLLFAEIPANNIIQWIPGKGASVFMHPSGYKGSKPFKGREPGSNGKTLDADGRVSVAGHAGRTVWRMESVDPKAQITILADSYQGKKLNSPNDLWSTNLTVRCTSPILPTAYLRRVTTTRTKSCKSTAFTASRKLVSTSPAPRPTATSCSS